MISLHNTALKSLIMSGSAAEGTNRKTCLPVVDTSISLPSQPDSAHPLENVIPSAQHKIAPSYMAAVGAKRCLQVSQMAASKSGNAMRSMNKLEPSQVSGQKNTKKNIVIGTGLAGSLKVVREIRTAHFHIAGFAPSTTAADIARYLEEDLFITCLDCIPTKNRNVFYASFYLMTSMEHMNTIYHPEVDH